MKFSVWPDLNVRPTKSSTSPGWPTPKAGTASGSPTTTCRTPASEDIRAGDMHECWAMLPAIAAVTERVRVGSLVAPTSVHHPAVLANRAATIDHISNGRMVLGVGAGWQINEHHAYGIELEPPAPRVDAVRRGDPDHPVAADRGAHRLRRRRTTTITDAPCRPEADPVAAADPRRHRQPADAADHRPSRRRVEHLGRPRRSPASGVDKFASRPANTVGPRPGDDAHVGPGARLPDRRRRLRGRSVRGGDMAPRRSPDRPSELVDSSVSTPSSASTSSSSPTSPSATTGRRSARDRALPHAAVRRRVAHVADAIVRNEPCSRRRARRPITGGTWRRRLGDRVGQEATAPAGRRASACFTALTPPSALTSFFAGPRPGRGCRRARSRHPLAAPLAGGTCWRTGAPRRGSAAA